MYGNISAITLTGDYSGTIHILASQGAYFSAIEPAQQASLFIYAGAKVVLPSNITLIGIN